MQKGVNSDVNNINLLQQQLLDLGCILLVKCCDLVQSQLGCFRAKSACISNSETKSDRAHILAKTSIGNDGHIPIIGCASSQNHAPQKPRQKAIALEPTLRRARLRSSSDARIQRPSQACLCEGHRCVTYVCVPKGSVHVSHMCALFGWGFFYSHFGTTSSSATH